MAESTLCFTIVKVETIFSLLTIEEKAMSDREVACWIVGGILILAAILMGGAGYIGLEQTSMTTNAWIEVAREMSKGLSDLGR